MIDVHSSEQIRGSERRFFSEHPDADLMSSAASAVARHAREMAGRGTVLVLAGPGNNGGDGLFAAAELVADGGTVHVVATHGRAHEAGMAAARRAGCSRLELTEVAEVLADCDLVIDAVLGIGGRPGLDDALALVAEQVDAMGIPVLAVDLPSGLDADKGIAGRSFRATRTVTFAAHKPCHVLQPAAGRCGEVVVADIGLDLADDSAGAAPVLQVVTCTDVARLWPVPDETSDKYSRGVVGLDTGSAEYPGAAVLGALGALHSGAGMVRFTGLGAACDSIRTRMPSVVQREGRVQAWVLGSGWGLGADNAQRLAKRLQDRVPCVIDADALGILPAVLPANSLLTPHAGELARILGWSRQRVMDDPIAAARRVALERGATVLLKGATQYVVEPEGRVRIAVPGPAWTAQAGSGDVLAGICGTLLAAGLAAADAALLAASVQAMAAASRPGPWPADVIASEVSAIVGVIAQKMPS